MRSIRGDTTTQLLLNTKSFAAFSNAAMSASLWMRSMTPFKFLLCLSLSIAFLGATQDVHAIGGSGSCTRDSVLIRAASFGTPNEMDGFLKVHIQHAWNSLDLKTRRTFEANSGALEEWRVKERRNFANYNAGGCGTEFLLDKAVANGNLDVVRWLLDIGASPNGTEQDSDSKTIFTRCNAYSPEFPRSDAMTQDQVTSRSKQAFKLLIDHGADLNRVWFGWERGPENALMTVLIYCHDDRAIKMLLDLGADRSPHLAGVERKYAPLQVATYLAVSGYGYGGLGSIEAVRILAHGGFNDLRGTRAESTLGSICVEPKNRARCKEVASIVRLNPGMIPEELIDTRPNKPHPREFSTYREVCSFPELRFVADYDFVAIAASNNLWPDAGYQIGPAHPVSVTVNFPGKPVILYLEGEEPTAWTLRRTAATKIIGVVVGKPHEADRRGRQHAIAGIDTNVPIYIGRCAGWVSFSYKQQPRLFTRDVRPDSLDPFTRADNAKFFALLSDNAVIGDALPLGTPTISSSTLTSEEVGVEQPRKKKRKALQHAQ